MSYRRFFVHSWALALGTALAVGCSRANASAADASAHELVVTAADFHFRSALTVPAGLTRVILHNEGTQFHHVQLVRLEDGHTFPELMQWLASGDFKQPWMTFVGGPDSPQPGSAAETTLQLTPGNYAMICLIASADNTPHVAKGMALPLTVLPGTATKQKDPEVDAQLLLFEYAFDLAPAISAGKRTIRVQNAGTQPHHVAFVRLGPGRTAADAVDWFKDMIGTAPDVPIGGTTAIGAGMVNFVTADFAPGRYALICFLPDEKDGRSHARHGMLREISVL